MKFHNFTQGLEEVFPLTEQQKQSLKEVGEPEIARLYYLKNNIFRGVNRLRDKEKDLVAEIEKLKEERMEDDSELIELLTAANQEADKLDGIVEQTKALIEIKSK